MIMIAGWMFAVFSLPAEGADLLKNGHTVTGISCIVAAFLIFLVGFWAIIKIQKPTPAEQALMDALEGKPIKMNAEILEDFFQDQEVAEACSNRRR